MKTSTSLIRVLMTGIWVLFLFGAFASPALPASAQAQPACVPTPAGIVGWWPGDGNTDDIVGGNAGVLANGAALAGGLVNGGFGFDGIDDFVGVAHTSNLVLPTRFTVEFWFMPYATILPDEIPPHTLFGNGGDYTIGTQNAVPAQPAYAVIEVRGPDPRPNSITNTWQGGVWYHVAVVQDTAFGYRLYVNGVEEGNSPDTLSILGAPNTITLGWDNYFDNTAFGGAMDEVSIYNRALSQAEVYAIFSAGSAGKCKTGFTIETDDATVWANGHEKATLTVHLIDTNGQGIAGHLIRISADPAPVGLSISAASPGSDVTNSDGEATFVATSTDLGMINFTASDTQDPSLTSSVEVEFQRRKLVIQFLGIKTSLQCDPFTGGCVPSGDSDNFATLRARLQSQYGFEDDDLLWYSYNGGHVDYSTGKWQSDSYYCGSTAQSYTVSLAQLTHLINTLGYANPNTDFYLVGHSQGGLIAFQELGLMTSGLPAKTTIGGIITLDSPLGGTPQPRTWITMMGTCWNGGRAPSQLVRLYQTVHPQHHDQQGSRAILLCSLPGIQLCSSVENANAALRAPTFTFGSTDDAVYRPLACLLPGGIDITSSQIVSSAGGGLFALGADPWLGLLDCLTDSHSRAYTFFAASAAAIIGHQFGYAP